ncbi:hypothetical protein E4198_06105 [Streptomyces sp. RKND-216]|uniref:hypothetical protein n=1 Tax=Streptomyces sp. RKND-216 TaxID=2562581 RepID=UPI00109D9F08|nr:hypothetical protein [Streptomyces sp. RKND-216]THA24375.1 hypothetical protein E4198_06105 [Streptomyces sp. RKND-216]
MRVNKTVSAVFATTIAGAVALGGVTAATAFAADEPRPQAAQQAPLPKAQKLQQQTRVLGETGDVLHPVAELIDSVLNAPEGRLSQREADRHAKAVQEALAPLQAQQTQNSSDRAPRANLTARAAVALEAQVDELLQAAESGNQRRIAKEAEATVQATVNVMAAVVADGELPAPDMNGLSQPQDAAPNAQRDEQDAQEEGPQLAENRLAPGDAELEMLPGDAEQELLPQE